MWPVPTWLLLGHARIPYLALWVIIILPLPNAASGEAGLELMPGHT